MQVETAETSPGLRFSNQFHITQPPCEPAYKCAEKHYFNLDSARVRFKNHRDRSFCQKPSKMPVWLHLYTLRATIAESRVANTCLVALASPDREFQQKLPVCAARAPAPRRLALRRGHAGRPRRLAPAVRAREGHRRGPRRALRRDRRQAREVSRVASCNALLPEPNFGTPACTAYKDETPHNYLKTLTHASASSSSAFFNFSAQSRNFEATSNLAFFGSFATDVQSSPCAGSAATHLSTRSCLV